MPVCFFVSVSLSFSISLYLSMSLSIYLIYLSVCLSVCLPVLSLSLSVSISTLSLSIHSIYPSIYLPAYLSICLSISIHPSCICIWKEAIMRDFRQKVEVDRSKMEQFCEKSFKKRQGTAPRFREAPSNSQSWQHQNRSNSTRLPSKKKLNAELTASYQCVLRFFIPSL